jgi:phosphoribosylformimino-5-aminoimidazole carboxamide ribonucleotide (ProFAR) isomerase
MREGAAAPRDAVERLRRVVVEADGVESVAVGIVAEDEERAVRGWEGRGIHFRPHEIHDTLAARYMERVMSTIASRSVCVQNRQLGRIHDRKAKHRDME